jgi:hypothetical protein
MTDDRVTRGRRVLGQRRLCGYLAGIVGLMVGVAAPIADAASGGAGVSRHAGAGSQAHPAKPTNVPVSGSAALAARGMWIWYVSQSNGGNISSVVARAHRYGIKTLMIKSGDGVNVWSQFSSSLISTLHANGLRVCAWQYVYGNSPATEAHVGATAVSHGADCLLIDAEGEYEGKYVQAQRYITTLRKLIGPRFAVALAGFPYIDYHPGFPYSVFLGPGGAQYNVPQMYWFDIGTSVDAVYAHTYTFNRVYQRPIYPLGELTGPPSTSDIVRFRQLSLAYGAGGVSWWDWQEAGNTWRAMSEPIGSLANFTPITRFAQLGHGAVGDMVVWAQEHLVAAGQKVKVDGNFGSGTLSAVRRFQSANGLSASGLIDTTTWRLLLRYTPAPVHWTMHSKRLAAAASASGGTPVPLNASVPAVRNEIAGPGGIARGRH